VKTDHQTQLLAGGWIDPLAEVCLTGGVAGSHPPRI
jgi:hypothetical protein